MQNQTSISKTHRNLEIVWESSLIGTAKWWNTQKRTISQSWLIFFKYFWMFNWLIDYLLLKHPVLNVIHIQEQIYRVLATTVPLVERELPTLPEHLPLPPVFSGVRVARSLVFCMVFCVSLFIILLFLLWPLRCLSFSDLRLMITPLVSSHFSYRYINITQKCGRKRTTGSTTFDLHWKGMDSWIWPN